jgi:hypothetical protein
MGPIFCCRWRGRAEFVGGKLRIQPCGEVLDAGLVFNELTEGDFEAEVFFEGVGGGRQEKGVETEIEERSRGIGGGGVNAGDLVELGLEFGNEMGVAGEGEGNRSTGVPPVRF